jgi:DNA-binding response OmpR family regulator
MPAPSPLILVAEDDQAIATGLKLNLELEGFRSLTAHDGEEAAALIRDEMPSLVLLDIAMPKKDGLELLSELRRSGNQIPVIVLSARNSEADKVAALRLGADDYITKPFALAELMARVDAVLRRANQTSSSDDLEPVRDAFGDVEVARSTRSVQRKGEPVALTHLEFELLCYFLDHPRQVLERSQLLREVWGTSGSKRTVDNFVGQLRSKLESDPEEPVHFVTIRGSGYRFDP